METLIDIVAYIVFFVLIGYAVVADIRRRIIPNWVIFGTIIIWIIWQSIIVAIDTEGVNLDNLISAVVVFAGLLALTSIAEKISGKYMFGGGDIKLVAVSTLFLGFSGVAVALLFACLISLIYAVAKLPRGIPFAPCMFCGTLVALML